MRQVVTVLALVSGALLTLPAAAAATPIIIDLDATLIRQAAPFGNGPVINLAAGTYAVTPISISEGGSWDAWSPWPSNLNCGPDGVCERGFQVGFDYSSPSLGYVVGPGTQYATPEQAASQAVTTYITLFMPEQVSFGFNECLGCLADNRGGLTLSIEAVPEPASLTLLGLGLLGFASYRLRRRV